MVVFSVAALIILLAASLAVSGSYRLEARAAADPSRELRDLRLAQTVRPWSAHLHTRIARVLLRENRLADATRELSHTVKPSGKVNLQVAAYTALDNGGRAEAERLLSESKRRGGDPLDGRLEAFLALPDLARAAQSDATNRIITEDSVRGVTTEPSRLLYSSRLLLAYHLIAPAHEFATQLTRAYPLIPLAWRQLATVQLAENNPDAALTSLEQSKALSPTDRETYRLEAQAYAATGQTAKAAQAEAMAHNLR